MDNLQNVRSGTIFWIVFGAAVAALAGFVVYSFFGAVVVGVFLYYGLRPIYQWLDDRLEHPDVTATITLLVVGLLILLALAYATLTGVRRIDQFLQTANLEQYRTLLRPYIDLAGVTQIQQLVNLIRGNLRRVLRIGTLIFRWGLRVFILLTVAFYLLRDDQKIASWFRRTFEDHSGVVTFMEGVDDDLTIIYIGNLITIAITGLIAVIVYYALDFVAPKGTGVAFPILLGAADRDRHAYPRGRNEARVHSLHGVPPLAEPRGTGGAVVVSCGVPFGGVRLRRLNS